MGTGARVALRANAIVLAAVVFVVGSAPDGLATLRHILVGTVADTPSVGVRILLAGVSAALARAAVPRVMLGSYGWQRSLPVDPRILRRAAIAAVTMVQFPVTVFALVAVAVVSTIYRVPVDLWRVLSIPVTALSIACMVFPDRRIVARVLAAGAVAASVMGSWQLTALAVGLILASDQVARGWGERRAVGRWRSSARWSSALSIWIAASWRAIGVREGIGVAVGPLIVCAFAHFIARNNALSHAAAARPVRVCGAIAIATLTAGLANVLLRKRPPWPWARSLPWAATRRVMADVIVIGAPLLIVPAALAPVHGAAALGVAGTIPLAAAIGAASVRVGATRQTGAAGESLLMVGTVGAFVALWPALSLAALAATPFALRWAGARERGAAATRWDELHHQAAGDPGWFTA